MKWIGSKTGFAVIGSLAASLLVMGGARADVDVYVGYADGLRVGGFFPNPWSGDPGVQFFGAGTNYDSGAFMFVNTGASNVTIGPGLHVDHFQDSTDYQIWNALIGSGVTVAPGDKAIFTQTFDNNFDTSDNPIQGQPANTAQPEVHVTLDGNLDTFTDSKPGLDTFGFDPANFPTADFGPNESIGWRLIGHAGRQELL